MVRNHRAEQQWEGFYVHHKNGIRVGFGPSDADPDVYEVSRKDDSL